MYRSSSPYQHLLIQGDSAMDYFASYTFLETFERVWHVFAQRWTLFLGISTLVYVVGWIFALLASLVLGGDAEIDGFRISYTVDLENINAWAIVFYAFEAFVYYVFTCIAKGASVWLVAHVYIGQSPSGYDAFQKGVERAFPLVASLIITAFAMFLPAFPVYVMALYSQEEAYIFLAMLAVWAWSVFLMVVFYQTYPVIMVENLGPMDALSRAFDLARQQWCYILCVLCLWSFFKFVIALFIAFGFSMSYPSKAGFIICQILDACFGILFAAMEGIFQSVVYFRVRADQEELDHNRLAEEIGLDGDNYITMATSDSVIVDDDAAREAKTQSQDENDHSVV